MVTLAQIRLLPEYFGEVEDAIQARITGSSAADKQTKMVNDASTWGGNAGEAAKSYLNGTASKLNTAAESDGKLLAAVTDGKGQATELADAVDQLQNEAEDSSPAFGVDEYADKIIPPETYYMTDEQQEKVAEQNEKLNKDMETILAVGSELVAALAKLMCLDLGIQAPTKPESPDTKPEDKKGPGDPTPKDVGNLGDATEKSADEKSKWLDPKDPMKSFFERMSKVGKYVGFLGAGFELMHAGYAMDEEMKDGKSLPMAAVDQLPKAFGSIIGGALGVDAGVFVGAPLGAIAGLTVGPEGVPGGAVLGAGTGALTGGLQGGEWGEAAGSKVSEWIHDVIDIVDVAS